ncbi:hypothetical protein [Halobacillus sp. BAB-2008]|uniref:hypothetical protein n=1 Tax=Halobacillus sp. BAB-2008 TaxID=1246484 RepID=UPI0002A4E0BB|nr:hypothetical protein [Halobacillus sp. BAB-2008]ELK47186.1 hypothetical protein D479_07032 [Halobacillus sp. BAB-2008]
MFRVIQSFTDAHTRQVYKEGDNYPRRGQVSKERVEELSSDQNKLGKPLIEPFNVVTEEEEQETPQQVDREYPRHAGGAFFELSNGKKVKGKEEAMKAESELDGSDD